MTETKTPNRLAAIDRHLGAGDVIPQRRAGDNPDGYPGWLARKGNANRHAAITKNLYNWNNYKNWAEKARSEWDGKK
jgi:hypothetical protein